MLLVLKGKVAKKFKDWTIVGNMLRNRWLLRKLGESLMAG